MFFYSSDAIIQMTVFFPSLHYIFTLSFRTDSFYLYFIVLRHCHSFSFNYSNSCTSCLYCTRVARWITVFFINFTHSMLTNSYRLVVIPIDHVKICTTPKPKQTKRSSRLWIKKKPMRGRAQILWVKKMYWKQHKHTACLQHEHGI